VYDEAGGWIKDGRYPLVYYLGYYLPAAVAGKIAGWEAANWALLFWTGAGIFLALAWFSCLAGNAALWVPVFFLFAGGLDAAGALYLRGTIMVNNLERWAHPWVLMSNTPAIFWAPQHSLGGWLASALVLAPVLDRAGAARPAALAVAASMFWSPFVTAGLAPFLILLAVTRKESVTRARVCLAAFAALGLVLALFYLALERPPHHLFLGERIFVSRTLKFLTFFVLEILAWVVPVFLATGRGRERGLLLMSAGLLTALCFYRVGIYNDLMMRASIPALLLLWVLAARALAAERGWLRAGLAALLLAGAVSPALEMQRALDSAGMRPLALASAADLPRIYADQPADVRSSIVTQYLGTEKAFFFRYLAK
jgi:hypothetical protein